jgi:hypothetical protein
LLDTLFDVGDKVMAIDWEPGTFRASPFSCWAGLVHELLMAWAPEAGLHLEQCFRSTKSVSLCATVFVQRGRELGKIQGNSGGPSPITMDALDALGKVLLPKIEEEARNGMLVHAPRIWDITQAWKYCGRAPEAKAWLNKNMSGGADFLSKVTEGFVRYTIGSEPRHYNMTERPDPDLYDLAVVLDAARKHLKGDELTDDARNRVGVVAKMVERQLVIDREEQARVIEPS